MIKRLKCVSILLVVLCATVVLLPPANAQDRAAEENLGKLPAKTPQAWSLPNVYGALRYDPENTYLQYVALQLARSDVERKSVAEYLNRGRPWNWQNRNDRRADLYKIMSAAAAVQETLQLDAMLGGEVGDSQLLEQLKAKYRKSIPWRDGMEWEDRQKLVEKEEARVTKIAEKELAVIRERIVSIEKLTGPTIESHPWSKMLKAKKEQGIEPQVSPLALCVPEDQYYVLFRSVSKLLEMTEIGDVWGRHIFNQAARSARTSDSSGRIKQQLAIRTDPMSRPFYDKVVAEVALTGSDLMLREGSDVTMLFLIKEPTVFRLRMDSFLGEFKQKYDDATIERGEIEGVSYIALTTPDRELNVYSAYPREDLHVRSNSKEALRRTLAAIAGKARRLGDSKEYQYIRTLMQRGDAHEDGLVYLSDPFVRHMVSPQLRIAEARRMKCYNNMRMISHGSMMFRTQYGRLPKSLTELYAAGCVPGWFGEPQEGIEPRWAGVKFRDRDDLTEQPRDAATNYPGVVMYGNSANSRIHQTGLEGNQSQKPKKLSAREFHCPCGGTYSLSADGSFGECSVHGRADSMTPCVELPIEKVTGVEQLQYERFVERYSSYWRTFFDPIVIRLEVSDDCYRAETIVLPLIDNTIYRGLSMALGGEPEPLDALPVPEKNIMTIAFRLNKEAGLAMFGNFTDEALDMVDLPRENSPGGKKVRGLFKRFLSEGIGNQVSMNYYDCSPLFELNVPELFGLLLQEGGGGMDDEMLPIGFVVSSLNSPVYLAIPVNDTKIVDEFLEMLDPLMSAKSQERSGGGFIDFESDFTRLPLGDDQGRIRCFAFKLGPLKWRLFYARIGDGLYIASKKFILDDIAALEADKTIAGKDSGPAGHAMIRVRSDRWNEVLPSFQLGWLENNRQGCLDNYMALANVARAMTADGRIGEYKDPTDAVLREATRLYGQSHFCPEGGHYKVVAEGCGVECSVHGPIFNPLQPAEPLPESGLTKWLDEMRGLTLEMEFLEDGLHATVTVQRKKDDP